MSNVINYQVATGASAATLKTAVEALVVQGWSTQGGVSFDGTNYAQAMMKVVTPGNVSPFVGTYVITAVTTGVAGAASVTVDGDQIINFPIDFRFTITGSTGKDGTYQVRAAATIAGGDTVIPVDQAISNATVDGTVVGYAVF